MTRRLARVTVGRITRMRGVRYAKHAQLALACLGLGALASGAGCFGATEVRVDISTDIACSPVAPTTSLFVGARGSVGATANATTSACTPGAGAARDNAIGSIVVIPQGDRDGRFSFKAVLAVAPKTPDACTAESPQGCIVATRSVGFIEHSSRTLPIRLTASCLDIVCPDPATQTCVDGRCVSNDVETDCGNTGCTEPVPPGIDGGPDGPPVVVEGGVDGGSDAPPGPCGGLDEDGALAQLRSMPERIHAGATQLYWLEEDAVEGTVIASFPKRPVKGDAIRYTKPSDGDGAPVPAKLLVAGGPTVWFNYQFGILPENQVLIRTDLSKINESHGLDIDPTGIAVGSAAGDDLFIVSASQTKYRAPAAAKPLQTISATQGGLEVAATSARIWTRQATQVLAYDRAENGNPAPALFSGDFAAIRANGFGAFGVGARRGAGVTTDIVMLNDGSVGSPVAISVAAQSSGAVRDIAVDAQGVFWTENPSASGGAARVVQVLSAAKTGGPELVLASGFSVMGPLAVDASPLASGDASGSCVYFAATGADGFTRLRAAPKK